MFIIVRRLLAGIAGGVAGFCLFRPRRRLREREKDRPRQDPELAAASNYLTKSLRGGGFEPPSR